MTPIVIQVIIGFVSMVAALIHVIYRLFNSTIELKIEAVNQNTINLIETLKKDFSNDLNNGLNKLHMDIELCRHEKKFLEAMIRDHVEFNNSKNVA